MTPEEIKVIRDAMLECVMMAWRAGIPFCVFPRSR
jgi:hypothetical protein